VANILLADDDAATRDFVRRTLEADGHKIAATQDGGDALDRVAAATAPFDLLISDINMPTVDGIALASRAVQAMPALRVLLISGFAEELTRGRDIAAVRIGHLAKPFTLDQLRDAVRAILR